MSRKRVVILGSTGSIGVNALEVIAHHPDRFEVLALSTHRSWRQLAEQVARFKPRYAAVCDSQYAADFKRHANSGVTLVDDDQPLVTLASLDEADIVLDAVVGAAGMPAALAAVDKGKRLALANKEALVMAGELVMRRAAETGAEVLPVDSEHSAIFQSLLAGRRQELRRVVITASGGPFRETPPGEMAAVTPEQALAHPTWSMGPKITIDSATLMNKALEVVEARWLFDLEAEKIGVVVHPESIVHSMVEFDDASVIAQMGLPDMKVPIQYALTYPERLDSPAASLNLAALGRLSFYEPDIERFEALALGFEVVRRGGTSGAVLNAANEVAVAAFLDGHIGFADITRIVGEVMRGHHDTHSLTVETLLRADADARREAAARVSDASKSRL